MASVLLPITKYVDIQASTMYGSGARLVIEAREGKGSAAARCPTAMRWRPSREAMAAEN
jgi:hypothetical protein